MPARRSNDLSAIVFSRLARIAGKLRRDVAPEGVHRLRTGLRRLQALLEHAGDRKLPKSLERLRKDAGKLRDLDVQREILDSVKVGRNHAEMEQVRAYLEGQRQRRARKLQANFDDAGVRKLRAKLEKLQDELAGVSRKVQPAVYAEAKAIWLKAIIDFGATDERNLTLDNLHELRLACKQARYTAELAGEAHAEGQALVAQMKELQDAIGEWHDWDELSKKARLVLKVDEGVLISALENLTRARFAVAKRKVVTAATRTLELAPPAPRKQPQRVPLPAAAARA